MGFNIYANIVIKTKNSNITSKKIFTIISKNSVFPKKDAPNQQTATFISRSMK